MKVAIVGLAPSTHDKAPFGDCEWEVWGLPWDKSSWAYMNRLFEIHDIRWLKSDESTMPSDYLDFLKSVGVPLYMQDDTLPGSTAYPVDEVVETIGAHYLNSSIAYAFALAIHEGAEEISLYGVDMKGEDEYGYQKPNMEYLIGFARGKGIKVTIPDESPLCKFEKSGVMSTYHKRYGWLG